MLVPSFKLISNLAGALEVWSLKAKKPICLRTLTDFCWPLERVAGYLKVHNASLLELDHRFAQRDQL